MAEVLFGVDSFIGLKTTNQEDVKICYKRDLIYVNFISIFPLQLVMQFIRKTYSSKWAFFMFAFSVFSQINIFFSQTPITLQSEVKAYLFHVVRKSPILEKNLGYAFEYSGPKVYLRDKSVNYDSLEHLIINQPELLYIRTDEIAKAPKGLLLELTNKTAVWMLNKALNDIQNGIYDYNQDLYNDYITQFNKFLPKSIIRQKSYEFLFDPKQSPIFNSNLSLYDRGVLLQQIGFTNPEDQFKILKAQHLAINQTIQEQCFMLFKTLGGNATEFENYLFAAGDGSYTNGILSERERDDDGNWNKGLPKAIGLFPYDLELKNEQLVPLRMVTRQMETCGKGLQTNLHFDVWGYNTSKQTTIVIEKDGWSYHLYGSENTRFLSPDSSFSKGYTFHKVINHLEKILKKDLEPVILGKKGYNIEIDEVQKALAQTAELIRKEEIASGISPIALGKPKNKKSKKKTDMSKWSYELQDLYQEYINLEGELDDLFRQREPYLKEYLEAKSVIDKYKESLGLRWMPYIERDGLYIFRDSSIFNVHTQEFLFPSTFKREAFEVRLIAIPEDLLGVNADEVMLHVSKVDIEPMYDADLRIEFFDSFDSDAFQLNRSIFTEKDTATLRKLFHRISKKSPALKIEVIGNGIGKWEEGRLLRDPEQLEMKNYPGKNINEWRISRAEPKFARLRKTMLYMKIDKELHIKIDSYTDPVVSNLIAPSSTILKMIEEGQITKNEALSAYRSLAVLEKLKIELSIYAAQYLPPDKAKKWMDSLNNHINRSSVSVGKFNLYYNDFY